MECAVGVPRGSAGFVRAAVVIAPGLAAGADRRQKAGGTENGACAHAAFADFSTGCCAGARRRQRMMLSKADAGR